MAPHMEIERTRLVFTIFGESDRLWDAVLALLDKGLEVGQLCIIALDGRRPHLDSTLNAAAGSGRRVLLASLLQTMKPCPWLGESRAVVATTSPVLAQLGDTGRSSSRSTQLSAALAALSKGVSSMSSLGATGLLVSSRDPEQQSMVTRTLLDHSSHWVTTHEYAAAPLREPCTTA